MGRLVSGAGASEAETANVRATAQWLRAQEVDFSLQMEDLDGRISDLRLFIGQLNELVTELATLVSAADKEVQGVWRALLQPACSRFRTAIAQACPSIRLRHNVRDSTRLKVN